MINKKVNIWNAIVEIINEVYEDDHYLKVFITRKHLITCLNSRFGENNWAKITMDKNRCLLSVLGFLSNSEKNGKYIIEKEIPETLTSYQAYHLAYGKFKGKFKDN